MTNYENLDQVGMDEAPTQAIKLRAVLEKVNLLEDMDEDTQRELATQVADGFEADMVSRVDWEKNIRQWTDLALQVKEDKSYPWPGAANVKYPLLSTAAMQFNARAYPSLVPNNGDIVKCDVIGADPDDSKHAQAKRTSKYMSFQILHGMDNWEDDMDKLLIMLPITGCAFKKTYYSPSKRKAVSELVNPADLVVNYWAKSLDDAERVSQIILMNKRQLKERQKQKIFVDVDLGDPTMITPEEVKGAAPSDSTMPYQIIEQHTYFDTDDDGYAEPVIVTFERATRKLLRVVPRFDDTGIQLDDDDKLVSIQPIQYFTKFGFIPNPDGGFYDVGFGLLLGPINEAVNTTINQLLDAGHLNNMQGGFLGKGLKLKMGETSWAPGEWKSVQTTADDLRKQVIPLPTKEPSKVLFELMGTMISSGKELASVAEIFVGKMPGQNTPATTTMATIEQGMKVFTAVYKRVFRSLREEYRKLFVLNSLYLDVAEYQNVLDEQVSAADFDLKTYNICPNSDPSSPTQTEKLMKAQATLELLATGVLDPIEVVRRVLEAQEQPNIERLFNQQIQQTGQFQPAPDPKLLALEQKQKSDENKHVMEMERESFRSELQARDQQFQQMMQAQKQEQDLRHEALLTMLRANSEHHKNEAFIAQARQQAQQKQDQHVQNVVHKEQSQAQKLAHAKEQAKSTKNSSGNGKTTRSQRR